MKAKEAGASSEYHKHPPKSRAAVFLKATRKNVSDPDFYHWVQRALPKLQLLVNMAELSHHGLVEFGQQFSKEFSFLH